MNLSPRHLRIFVFLANSLSFSRTADEFCLAQPTLSKIVREMEEEMGVRLFERTTRSVKLTRDGEALVRVAARVADDYDNGISQLEEITKGWTHRIAVAALPTLAAMLLPEPLAALRAEEAGAAVQVHDVFTDQALALLREAKVDFVLGGMDAVHRDLRYRELLRDPYVVLSSARRPLPRGLKRWDARQLSALPLLTLPRTTGTQQYMNQSFLRGGVELRPTMELNSIVTVARFVKAGLGYALVPRSSAQMVMDKGLTASTLDGAPERVLAVITRRDLKLSSLALKLVRLVGHQAKVLNAAP